MAIGVSVASAKAMTPTAARRTGPLMRLVPVGALLVGVLLPGVSLSSCVPSYHRTVAVAPPPPMVAGVYYEGRPGYVWVEGRWVWDGSRWLWLDGYWAPEREGYVFVQGYWELRGDVHVWVDGFWQRERPGLVWVRGHWSVVEGRHVWVRGRWDRPRRDEPRERRRPR